MPFNSVLLKAARTYRRVELQSAQDENPTERERALHACRGWGNGGCEIGWDQAACMLNDLLRVHSLLSPTVTANTSGITSFLIGKPVRGIGDGIALRAVKIR